MPRGVSIQRGKEPPAAKYIVDLCTVTPNVGCCSRIIFGLENSLLKYPYSPTFHYMKFCLKLQAFLYKNFYIF